MEFWGHITTFFSAENYTLFVVGIGSGILCFASGVVGTFTYLRKRALIGDVISHSVLPGVAIAFMLTGVKNPFYFLIGAVISGLLSILEKSFSIFLICFLTSSATAIILELDWR